MRWVAALLVWALFSALDARPARADAASTCAFRDTPVGAPGVTSEQLLIASLCLVNAERLARGIPALHVDRRLTRAAQRHANDMAHRGFFAHVNPEGCDPSCRAMAAGYPIGAGENLYRGPTTAAAAVRGWMASPGHYVNVVDPHYWTVGIGGNFADDTYWAHSFGAKPPKPSAVTGLEPRFQGPADPTGTVPPDPAEAAAVLASSPVVPTLRGLKARVHRGRVLITGRATHAFGRRVDLTFERRDVRISARTWVKTTGRIRSRFTRPTGRGRLRITAQLGVARVLVPVRRAG